LSPELAASFYNVEAVCWFNNDVSSKKDLYVDPKLALLPKCEESEWSLFYPDKKSDF
jgi:hypothetical protein